MKFWTWSLDFLKKNYLIVFLVLTAWFKLMWLDALMFDDPKGLSIIFFVAFTAASALGLFSIAFIFDKFRGWAGVLIGLFLSIALWADIVYYRYFGSIIKVETLSIANQTTGVGDSVLTLFSPVDILFFIDVFVVIVYLLWKKPRLQREPLKKRIITAILIFLISLLPISLMFWRDRKEHLDRFIFHNYDINSIEFRYGAIGAHGINTFRYVLTALEHLDKDEREAAVAWVSENAVGQVPDQYTGLAKGKNIFLIQMESLQSFVIGRKYEGQEITPNLNRLLSQSYYLPNGYTAVGGGLTSDSDFTANTSTYALRDASVFVQYGNDDFTSLPKALRDSGYSANAYHAYRRDFWNRGVALNSLGYEHFFARDEYEEDEIIGMGISDESFYRQTLEKLAAQDSKPDFNFLISLTSHHPFIMEEKYRKLKGDEAQADFKTFHYFQSVHYADYALGIFLEELKARGLYDDSLFVVYGDHTAKVGDYRDPKMAAMLGTFEPGEMVTTPYIYKLPKQRTGKVLSNPTSQLDIMPTVLNLAGVTTVYPMFGGNALSGQPSLISVENGTHYSNLMIRFNLFEEFTK